MIFRLSFQRQAGARGYARARRGFALVASLTLLMLLGLIAVGILAVASSQNRVAAQSILRDEARLRICRWSWDPTSVLPPALAF